MEMDGLVAVITGAGRGLGKAIAGRFFNEGARVAMWDSDLPAVNQARDELDPSGAMVMAARVDVAN